MTIELTSSPTFNLLLSTAPTPCTIKDSLVEKLNLFSSSSPKRVNFIWRDIKETIKRDEWLLINIYLLS